jgi:hypothetical protein
VALITECYDRGSRGARVQILDDIDAVRRGEAEDRFLIAEIHTNAH